MPASPTSSPSKRVPFMLVIDTCIYVRVDTVELDHVKYWKVMALVNEHC